MRDYPFQVSFDEVARRLEEFVSVMVSQCSPAPLVRTNYRDFETGYQALKRETSEFTNVTAQTVLPAVQSTPIALIVLRAMLGFTPPEWAYMATRRIGVEVPQGVVRSMDRRIRVAPLNSLSKGEVTQQRITALVEVACLLISEGAPPAQADRIHRLEKADTKGGLPDVQAAAKLGIPYPMLLYERFLGRPFAGHKDSVSELVGDALEVRIEEALGNGGISYRKTGRAAKIAGFDQAPDFIVPDEFAPGVVIEAKVAEDDGTARDKVTRVQHLAHLSAQGQPEGAYKYEVIACIGGRGFSIRREDMKKLLLATRGKVFTLKTLDRLVECTKLREFKSK